MLEDAGALVGDGGTADGGTADGTADAALQDLDVGGTVVRIAVSPNALAIATADAVSVWQTTPETATGSPTARGAATGVDALALDDDSVWWLGGNRLYGGNLAGALVQIAGTTASVVDLALRGHVLTIAGNGNGIELGTCQTSSCVTTLKGGAIGIYQPILLRLTDFVTEFIFLTDVGILSCTPASCATTWGAVASDTDAVAAADNGQRVYFAKPSGAIHFVQSNATRHRDAGPPAASFLMTAPAVPTALVAVGSRLFFSTGTEVHVVDDAQAAKPTARTVVTGTEAVTAIAASPTHLFWATGGVVHRKAL